MFKTGTGFFISDRGHIATCFHVLEHNNNTAPAVLIDQPATKSQWKGQFISADPSKDICIIKAECPASVALDLGSYSSAEEGDDVAFLGFPLGISNLTTHRGIISAKGLGVFPEYDFNVLQLDASVNMGNSGGPLIHISTRQVVGVVSAKLINIDPQLRQLSQLQPGARMTIGGIDPVAAIQAVIKQIEDRLQLGIGYAIPTDYLKSLIAKQ
ncbi:MAG: serine protease [Chloroflexota bacterium]